ncbi:MAG: exodeoxyribonuclease VII small subunit [Anaeromyxobacter sp. RBG_16_69_14]|nr:MAG: exodeoxyribonuclease VII small subunit [Anaeromyxobacter sp. RBG_16_69_14]
MNQAIERPAGAQGEATEPYDAVVARLERVVGELESGQLSLEKSIETFAEGVKLAREATRKLDEAERRIEMLVRNADGAEEEVPFDPEGGKSPCKSP